MVRQWFTWRVLLAFIAILIVSGTIWYSRYLAEKIARDEERKVQLFVEAANALTNPQSTDVRLPLFIMDSIILRTREIPIIATNERDSIMEFVNLDTNEVNGGWASDARVLNQNTYLKKQLTAFRSDNKPVEWIDPGDSSRRNRYYYGHSQLLDEVQWYPIIQLFIVGLFIVITIMALRGNYRSTQNQVWAGMAKETAHQLGTPVSSLEGWVEILRETHGNEAFLPEIEKDVTRLRLVSDRFGKIGSTPQLEPHDLVVQVQNMMDYIRKRAGGKVGFSLDTHGAVELKARISPPLFDWVIENLMKNGLDAMEGRGALSVSLRDEGKNVVIDVSDTGKGISKQNIGKVFKPGFTTKKRGWGLGLSLSKRIIEQYHKGSLFVKHSEPGKGTTFRIVLPK